MALLLYYSSAAWAGGLHWLAGITGGFFTFTRLPLLKAHLRESQVAQRSYSFSGACNLSSPLRHFPTRGYLVTVMHAPLCRYCIARRKHLFIFPPRQTQIVKNLTFEEVLNSSGEVPKDEPSTSNSQSSQLQRAQIAQGASTSSGAAAGASTSESEASPQSQGERMLMTWDDLGWPLFWYGTEMFLFPTFEDKGATVWRLHLIPSPTFENIIPAIGFSHEVVILTDLTPKFAGILIPNGYGWVPIKRVSVQKYEPEESHLLTSFTVICYFSKKLVVWSFICHIRPQYPNIPSPCKPWRKVLRQALVLRPAPQRRSRKPRRKAKVRGCWWLGMTWGGPCFGMVQRCSCSQRLRIRERPFGASISFHLLLSRIYPSHWIFTRGCDFDRPYPEVCWDFDPQWLRMGAHQKSKCSEIWTWGKSSIDLIHCHMLF